MEKQNSIQKEKQIQTALAVIESNGDKSYRGENEEVQSSKRGGRKGAAQSAQSLESGEQGHAAQYRVILSGEANTCLEELASKVNDGFDSGAVTKSDVANYVLLNLPRMISDADIRAIRTLHFDDKRVLGSLLRSEGDIPEDLKKALRAHFGIGDREKKKTTRALAEMSTDPTVEKSTLPPFEA